MARVASGVERVRTVRIVDVKSFWFFFMEVLLLIVKF
jgi:hypothetical protein